MIRHLKKHIVRRPGDTDLFWIRVTDQTPGTVLPSSGLWLDLEIRADLNLEVLDTFLRAVWVEYCHHLSPFVVAERQILCERDPEGPRAAADPWQGNTSGESPIAYPMAGVTIAQIAEHTLTFGYEYDYGTPTILSLQIMTRYQGPALEKGIRILAATSNLSSPAPAVAARRLIGMCSTTTRRSARSTPRRSMRAGCCPS